MLKIKMIGHAACGTVEIEDPKWDAGMLVGGSLVVTSPDDFHPTAHCRPEVDVRLPKPRPKRSRTSSNSQTKRPSKRAHPKQHTSDVTSPPPPAQSPSKPTPPGLDISPSGVFLPEMQQLLITPPRPFTMPTSGDMQRLAAALEAHAEEMRLNRMGLP